MTATLERAVSVGDCRNGVGGVGARGVTPPTPVADGDTCECRGDRHSWRRGCPAGRTGSGVVLQSRRLEQRIDVFAVALTATCTELSTYVAELRTELPEGRRDSTPRRSALHASRVR